MIDFNSADRFPVVVGIGEALFDCYPDRAILGGAPVNFIVHMQQLLGSDEGQTVLVSRVGDDDLGEQLIGQLQTRNIHTNLVQVDAYRPTGRVYVSISAQGEIEFDIEENVAWDFIAAEESLELLAAHCSAVCFGTLAQRNAHSRNTILRFLANATNAIRLLDVNLRQPDVPRDVLEQSFRAANVVKLNDGELVRISRLLASSNGAPQSTDDQAFELRKAFDLHLIALTRGARGTVLYTEGRRIESTPTFIRHNAEADGVGAGDACCAGLVYGLIKRWPLERTLDLANRLGAYVASQRGATPRLPEAMLNFETM
jgi:fructokinase